MVNSADAARNLYRFGAIHLLRNAKGVGGWWDFVTKCDRGVKEERFVTVSIVNKSFRLCFYY